jgi:MFS family permease
MILPSKISNHNFHAFLWHAGFLAFAQGFMDIDTVIPAMLIESGGKAVHIGIMTAIMMGGSSSTQLFFSPYVSNKSFKKKYLLAGINTRIFSLFDLRYIFVLGGVAYSVYTMTMNGLLLEVSGIKNRALYAGFAGAGNIMPAVFPFTGGWIINHFGFQVFSSIAIIIVLFSVYFIWKIDCKK